MEKAEAKRKELEKREEKEIKFTPEEIAHCHKIAEKYKEEGNQAMKDQKYKMATLKYTLAINKTKKPNHIYFANRALANLKQNRNLLCVQDCTKSIDLDPKYIKSYQRKSTALTNMKKY